MYLVVGVLVTTVAQAVSPGGPCQPAETAQDILNAVQASTDAVDICLAKTGYDSSSQLYMLPIHFARAHISSQVRTTILCVAQIAF